MDAYTFGLALGAVGLAAMAIGGLSHFTHIRFGRHGHAGARPGHAAARHGHGHGTARGHHQHASIGQGLSRLLTSLLSPRVLFSFALGFGAVGVALRTHLPGLVLAIAAIAGGAVFELALARPIWSLTDRFASSPALTLESCVGDEVRAVGGFNADGEGLVALELDGQIVQLLGRLAPEARQTGLRVRSGDRLFVREVDGTRHQVTVSPLQD